jgi:hypothetical protein
MPHAIDGKFDEIIRFVATGHLPPPFFEITNDCLDSSKPAESVNDRPITVSPKEVAPLGAGFFWFCVPDLQIDVRE